ncbi:MAG: triosephosphate isomerase [Candidatus Syntrophoarchaeum caldarius]|uniref:Triosephosphate isomerase n=1 Tax=Candidatus Syntropharchaeum caldarium TaxID=1838285 RepID=A0A1F2PA27_9EURY|nr:MAG: triosephosphate isomerase [Candidatus Syntrophoarchaeum caldarius]
MTKIKTPVIILNVKAYSESMGDKGLALAKACEEVTEESGITTVICPQQFDLGFIAHQTDVPCFAQHIDLKDVGGATGWALPEAAKAAGAAGTLINHAEHRLKLADIDALITRSRALGLTSVLCTNNIQVSAAGAALNPDMIAIEPPELIGTGVPVSKADPDIVTGSLQRVKEINKDVVVLCGAGISTGEDVKAAIELGTAGVLLASGVVKATDPKAVLLDLVSGI